MLNRVLLLAIILWANGSHAQTNCIDTSRLPSIYIINSNNAADSSSFDINCIVSAYRIEIFKQDGSAIVRYDGGPTGFPSRDISDRFRKLLSNRSDFKKGNYTYVLMLTDDNNKLSEYRSVLAVLEK